MKVVWNDDAADNSLYCDCKCIWPTMEDIARITEKSFGAIVDGLYLSAVCAFDGDDRKLAYYSEHFGKAYYKYVESRSNN